VVEAIIVSPKSVLLIRQQYETAKQASKTDILFLTHVNTVFIETILSHWMTNKILGWQLQGSHGNGFIDPKILTKNAHTVWLLPSSILYANKIFTSLPTAAKAKAPKAL